MCYNTTTGDGKYRAANRLVLQEYIKTMFFSIEFVLFLKKLWFCKKIDFCVAFSRIHPNNR